MQALHSVEIDHWQSNFNPEQLEDFSQVLESGKVLFLPKLGFELTAAEKRFLTPAWLDGSRKNISLEGSRVGGAQGAEQDLADLHAMLERFATQTASLLNTMFPAYQAHLNKARTSFRPSQVEGKPISWKKDDSRLHVDAFPSRPTHGERILRIFSNVNPNGIPRVWRVGEPFEDTAKRFMPEIPTYHPLLAKLMHQLKITKSVRSEYDHMMLHLHDRMKANMGYQKTVPQQTAPFPSGCTWICFSDQVLHAAMSGQFMFEQTFHLPVSGLQHPELSPLKVLERLTQKSLVASH